mgnify:CR=1 FL=1
MTHLGQFNGKDRKYDKAFPETANVMYNVYVDDNGKEYGVPVNSTLTIEKLVLNEQNAIRV